MSKRNNDALAIQLGACNPSGIAYSIIDACKECRKLGYGTKQICEDPAVRLMVHQLAFLCNVHEIDNSLSEYGRLTEALKAA